MMDILSEEYENLQKKNMQHITKLEKSGKNIKSKDSLSSLNKLNYTVMSTGLRQMRQMGQESLTYNGNFIWVERLEATELPELQESVIRKESSRKKEKDQEKDAIRRAKQNSSETGIGRKQQIQQSIQEFANKARSAPLPSDWKEIPTGLNGNEFAPDPQTKQIDLGNLLEKYRNLSAKVSAYKKNVKAATLQEQSVMEVNTNILLLLKDAIQTWSSASGVDIKTGKEISSSKQKEAKQHLELAMERYREAMENSALNIGNTYLKKLQETNKTQYKNKINSLKENDMASSKNIIDVELNVGYTNNEQISTIRQWIEYNPERYLKNQQIVDQIYKEFLANTQTINQELHHRNALLDLLPKTVNTGSVEDMATEALNKMKEESSLRIILQERQMDALSYLLREKEPENILNRVYMEQRWGIATKYREMDKTMIDGNEQFLGEEDAEVVRLMFREKKAYRQVILKIESALKKDPENQELKNRLLRLQRHNPDNLLPGDLIALQHAFSNRTIELGKLTTAFMHQKIQKTDGSIVENIGMCAAQYRDMAQMMTPYMKEFVVPTLEQMNKVCNTVLILEKGEYMNGKKATKDEIAISFMEESDQLTTSYEDLKSYIESKHDLYYRSNIGSLKLYQGSDHIFASHTKAQSLTKRCDILMKHSLFSTLPEEDQAEIKKMRHFFGGVMTYARAVLSSLNEIFLPKAEGPNFILGRSLHSCIEKHRLLVK